MTSSSFFSDFYGALVRRVYVDEDLRDDPVLGRIAEVLPRADVIVVPDKKAIPPDHMRQNTVYLTRDRGRRFGRCPGTPVHRCCNYHTIDVYEGCSLGCSYCIMKSYLNFAPLTVYIDTETVLREIREAAEAQPERFFRIGSGEVGDSLLLDPIFRLTEEYISGVADLPNVAFEAKTKTDFVDHLLEVEPKGNAVIGFSLNPEEFSTVEEGIARPVSDRIRAALRSVDAGYRVAFHFDPIVSFPTWSEDYSSLIGRLSEIPEDRIAWISMGTIRFTSGLRERIGFRPYMLDEYVPGRDGKFRYIQRRRIAVYRGVLDAIRQVFPGAPVYLCMESEAVWQRVFGALPDDLPALQLVFDNYE